jgi:uncharacterized protein (DUF885 family)
MALPFRLVPQSLTQCFLDPVLDVGQLTPRLEQAPAQVPELLVDLARTPANVLRLPLSISKSATGGVEALKTIHQPVHHPGCGAENTRPARG